MAQFTKPQLRATILLSFATFLVLVINELYNQYRLSGNHPDGTEVQDLRILDSLFALIPPENPGFKKQYEDGGTRQYGAAVLSNAAPVLNLHSFDPNTVSRKEWIEMGLPERVFNGLEKYREKGGRIRHPEQVLKLYHLDPETGRKMVAFVKPDSAAFANRSGTKPFAFKPYTPKPVEPLFDLNAADSTQLMKVFGIGGKTAKRILKYRTSIGGFVGRHQVYEVWGIDSSTIDELFKKAYLPEKPTIEKLKINLATEEELAVNPYIRKAMARVIVKYRNQHGPFASEADLLKIKILNPEVVVKIRPYLEF